MNSAHFYMNTGDLGSYFNLRTFGKTQRITDVTYLHKTSDFTNRVVYVYCG